MGLLKATLTDGTQVEFDDQQIGTGGEKVVFYTKDKKNVVCFFFKNLEDRNERRRRLDKIINNFNPTTGSQGDYWKAHFCWPTGIIDADRSLPGSFLTANNIVDPPLGILAPAYRGNFFFRNTLGATVEGNGKWFTSAACRKLVPKEHRGTLLTYLQVCTKMVRAIRRMHFRGLAHSDLSNKNVLIDPKNGDACLIDIDSLVVPGITPPSVLGTPGYIAPEVKSGKIMPDGEKALPCIETDRYAMAVLIYEMLLMRHPIMRQKPIDPRLSPEQDEHLAFGERALFVEHPTDSGNWPKPPPAVRMDRVGPYLSDLFVKAFVDGLHDRSKRPGSDQWERALYRTFDILHPSPDGNDWFVLTPGMPMQYPYTRAKLARPVPYAIFYNEREPGTFINSNQRLTIYHNLPLMRWHTTPNLSPSDDVDRTRQGYFSFYNDRWYLVNESGEEMEVINGDSGQNGSTIEITEGLQLRMSDRSPGRLLVFDFMHP